LLAKMLSLWTKLWKEVVVAVVATALCGLVATIKDNPNCPPNSAEMITKPC
jgi:hypothetical protein